MSGNWPPDPYRHNPDAPYRQDDVIALAWGKEPLTWRVLCVGRDTYFLERLSEPRYLHPHETIWTKWSCHQATVLVSRDS